VANPAGAEPPYGTIHHPTPREETMIRSLTRLGAAVVVCGSLVATIAAHAADRPPDVILADIDAIKEPTLDAARQKSWSYMQQVTRKRKEAAAQKAKLVGELYRVDPGNARLAALFPERWRTRFAALTIPSSAKELATELNDVFESTENADLKKEAAYWRARIAIRIARGDSAKVKAVDEFIELDRKDARGAELLATLASRYISSPDTRQALMRRLANDFPETSGADQSKPDAPQGSAVGKPFNLEFIDAISGSPVSSQRLKGKVLVVDFWATWCGPCVAEMPKMKELYAEYRNQGVQFIGVSLDQPNNGLERLVAFVEENGIAWPQYYQGNGWDSEFSKSWGIRSIPAVFVVDQEGKIYSDKARGKLETILPALLKRRPTKTQARAAETLR
jgi:thiol-disulfide isomerase/thioredoxin